MGEDVVRLSAVGQIIRRRWVALVAAGVVGALLGWSASLALSPGYASASRVLLQGEWDKADLQTQVLIATSSSVLDEVARITGTGTDGSELKDRVTAELGDGKVVEITAHAGDGVTAQRIAQATTDQYVIFSAKLLDTARAARQQVVDARRESLEKQLAAHIARIAELQRPRPGAPPDEIARAGADLERERSQAAQAQADLDGQSEDSRLQEAKAAQTQVNVVVLEPAPLPEHAAQPTPAVLAGGGAALACLLTVFGLVAAAARDPRLRREPDIEAALGSHLVGSVDVPVAGSTGLGARMKRLVHDDRPWDEPKARAAESDDQRRIRFRRAVERLRATPDAALRLLVVVPALDLAARRAVAELAAACGAEDRPAVVVTDSENVVAAVREVSPEPSEPGDTASVTVRSGDRPDTGADHTVLHVIEASLVRPVVPEDPRVSGALVVLTSGTRTAWELVGLTEACADAGVDVRGVLLTRRALPVRPPKAVPAPRDPEPAPPADEDTPSDPATVGTA